MDIALDKVCELILRAKAIDVKEGVTDPDSGSNPIDDGSTDVLADGGDDLTESEVRDVIAGLNSVDSQPGALPGQTYVQTLALGGVDVSQYISTGSNRDTYDGAIQPRVGFSYDFSADESFVQMDSLGHCAAAWLAQGDLAARRGHIEEAAAVYRRAAEALQDVRF